MTNKHRELLTEGETLLQLVRDVCMVGLEDANTLAVAMGRMLCALRGESAGNKEPIIKLKAAQQADALAIPDTGLVRVACLHMAACCVPSTPA